jgi:hypothetical protein
METTEGFVNAAFYQSGWERISYVLGAAFEPVCNNPRRSALQTPNASPITLLVHKDQAADGCADARLRLERLTHMAIESWQDGVISVEDVDDVTSCATDAGCEISLWPNIVFLAVEIDPPLAKIAHN